MLFSLSNIIIIKSCYYHYQIMLFSLSNHVIIIIKSCYYHYQIILLSLSNVIIIKSCYFHYQIMLLSLSNIIIIKSCYYHYQIMLFSLSNQSDCTVPSAHFSCSFIFKVRVLLKGSNACGHKLCLKALPL